MQGEKFLRERLMTWRNRFPILFLAVVACMAMASQLSAVLIFSDDFESNSEGDNPVGWTIAESGGSDVAVTEAPSWSPYGKVAQFNEPSNGSTTAQASIVKDGFNVQDFEFEFDMMNTNYGVDTNGGLTVILSDAIGNAIFSGQLNFHPDPALDSFDTGILNPNESDQSHAVFYQQFLGNPPYAGVHVKVATNHSAGTYDLTLNGVLYASNPLGANVVGKNLAKVEFIGGIGSANHTRVWLNDVSLSGNVVPEPSCVAMLGLATGIIVCRFKKLTIR